MKWPSARAQETGSSPPQPCSRLLLSDSVNLNYWSFQPISGASTHLFKDLWLWKHCAATTCCCRRQSHAVGVGGQTNQFVGNVHSE